MSSHRLIATAFALGALFLTDLRPATGAPENPGVQLSGKGLTGVVIYWPATGEKSQPHVQRVIEGSPAARAGVKPGDVYTHVDGHALAGLTSEEAMRFIRGRAGTVMRLRIKRKGTDKALYFEIPRESEDRIRRMGDRLNLP